ncbi:MAG: hypothetical protein ACKO0Z_05025 [Betaproteobacteria bacterium]
METSDGKAWEKVDAFAYAIVTRGHDGKFRFRVTSKEDVNDINVGKARTLNGCKRMATYWFNLS